MTSKRNKTGAQQTESPEMFDAFDSLSSSDIKPKEKTKFSAEPAITIPTKVRNDGPVRVKTARKVKEDPADYTEDMKEEFCGLQIASPRTNKQIALTSKEVDEGAHNNNENLQSVEPYLPSSATKLADISPTNCSDRSVVDLNQNNQASASKKLNAPDAHEYSRKLCDRNSITGKKDDAELLNHKMIHAGEKPFACSVCDRRFTENRCLQRHKVIHRGGELYACMYCRIPFDTREAMVNHREKEHPTTSQVHNMNMSAANGSTSIDYNNREGSTEKELNGSNEASANNTYRNDLDLPSNSVSLSSSSATNKEMVKKDVKQSHSNKESSDIVGQEPEQVHLFQMAIADETENVAPTANDIDKTMDVPTKSLDSPSNVAEKFKCSFCSKCYSKYSHFYHHQRSHKSGRPFVCSLCGTRFPRKGALLKHRLSHTGGKPFKCDVCDKRFVHPKYLADHMKYHTGKKNIACSICDKRFRGKVDLQRHKLIHTVNKPIACGICRRPFDTRDAMVNHKMKEHPTTCQIQNMNLSTANGSTSIDSNNREVSTGHELNGFNEASADETYPSALDILIRAVNLSIYPPINEDMVEKEVELSQTDKESSDIVGQEPEQVVANGNESIDSSQNSQDCESTVKERIAPAVNEYKRKLRDKSSLIGKKADVQSYLEPDSVYEGSHDDQSSEEDCSDSEYEDITDNRTARDSDDNNTSGDADSVLPSSSIKGAEIAISSPTSIDSQKAKKASRSMKIDSSTSTKLFQCDDCKKSFSSKHCLQRHKLIHTGEKKFSCSICAKRFSRNDYLREHLQIHSSAANNSSSSPPIKSSGKANCSAVSIDLQKANKASRSMRIESSKSAKLLQCDDCEKTFKYKSNLEEHKLSHTGEKPLSCSICEERFSRRFHLNRHQKKHTGEKPLSCSICEERFSRNDHLKRHLLTHSGERAFACSSCHKRFYTKYELRKHEHTHSGKRPHKCSICKKSFGRSYHLKRHILVHTGSLANVSTSIDSSILVDSTEKEPEHVNNQMISYKKGSIEEELERIASAHPNILYLVWSEEFSLDLALAVARNSSNCILILKNFSSTSLVEDGNMVETNDSSVVEIGPNPDSLRFFSFGRMILPRKILDNGRFKSISELESTMTKFFFVQGMQPVNVIQFTQGVDGWFVTLKRHLKEDLLITNT